MEECAARKCQSWVCLQMIQLQWPMGAMDTMQFYVIQQAFCWRQYELLVFSGPTEKFRIHEYLSFGAK